MGIDLASAHRSSDAPWNDPSRYWMTLDAATRSLPAPVVALNVEALAWNAHDLLRRAGGTPIRVASKSVRSRAVLESVLALEGYRGILAFTLAEAVWLSETIDDIVVAYPSADRTAIEQLAMTERAAERITIMIDSADQLDLVDAVLPAHQRAEIRVCIDLDSSWRSSALGHIGVRRSPVHDATAARALAETVAMRPGFRLVGVMAYEAQIAGVADQPRGKPAEGALMRAIQRASGNELRERRAAVVEAVSRVAELEFVNGGGTGSIERTVAEPCITEVAAGSGLYGPHIFDHYRDFVPAPAVGFALDVVRKPTPERVTLLGGGWIASGPPAADRMPLPVWPEGLRYEAREGAGEVQTPLRGTAARDLSVGDRVWLRHAKAGEIMEHAHEIVPVTTAGDRLDAVPTYRGEGKCFL